MYYMQADLRIGIGVVYADRPAGWYLCNIWPAVAVCIVYAVRTADRRDLIVFLFRPHNINKQT